MATTGNNELDIRSFDRLQTIHRVFCAILIVFILIIVLFNKRVGENVITPDHSLLFVALVTTALFPIISNYVFYRRVETIDLDESVKYRFSNYLTANVMRYLWLAGAGVINVCIWFLTATMLIAGLTAFLLLVLIIIRPVKLKVVRLLRMKLPK